MANLFYTFFFMILLTGCVGCGGSMKTSKALNQYEWFPSESADKQYPMEIVRGDFFYPNGDSIYIPAQKVINNGWGEVGSIHVAGKDIKPIPDRLKIEWFSYTENKFFAVDTPLPYDKLLNAFRDGIISPITGKKTRYDRIIVGLGLDGWVSIWVSGEWLTKEIKVFRAEESNVDWSTFFDNDDMSREEIIRETLSQYIGLEKYKKIQENGAPLKKWPLYLKRYQWQLQTSGPGQLQDIRLYTFNGEKKYYNFKDHTLPLELSNHSAPKRLDITWRNASGKQYVAEIRLNESEILREFEKYLNAELKDNIKFEIELGHTAQAIGLSLRCENYILVLESMNIEVYSAN